MQNTFWCCFEPFQHPVVMVQYRTYIFKQSSTQNHFVFNCLDVLERTFRVLEKENIDIEPTTAAPFEPLFFRVDMCYNS